MNFRFPLIAFVAWATLLPAIGQLPPGIVNTQPGDDQPPSPELSLEHISVPEGFHVSLYAGEPQVAQPIAIEFDDRGRLWVLESFSYIEWKRSGKDRLLIFEDTDNDGRFDKRTVFWDRGEHTSGFQIGFGGIWLCDAPRLLFIPDENRDDVPDGPPKVILDGWATDAEHNFFNGLCWGPDGWLYGRHGIKKPSQVGFPGTPDSERVDLSCCIWRYHPTKKRFEVWAEGTVNPWGLDWNEEGEAFINTSVIDHLWHLVPGARFESLPGRGSSASALYSFERMHPTSDHRHWIGGETGRKNFSGNDEAGGGHSHCGMVIYQSDMFPQEYRGNALFSNILGQRINMDRLQRRNSAWIATHGKDFLRSSSPWFRAVDLKQGPNGQIMIAEWTDLGECHDRDGIHRTSGRLYEVWYGNRRATESFNLAGQSIDKLLEHLYHENVWWRRHALRILHERSARGESLSAQQFHQLKTVASSKSAPIRDSISAIDALHAFDRSLSTLVSVYDRSFDSHHPDNRAAVRVHLLTLMLTEEEPSIRLIEWFNQAVRQEGNPMVLYRMAALLQRIPVEHRWQAAETLAKVAIPHDDRNFVLMRWYGFEPLVEANPQWAVEIALQPGHPWLTRAIARRAVSANALNTVLKALRRNPIESQTLESVLAGLLDALPSRCPTNDDWQALYPLLNQREEPSVQRRLSRLAVRFGDSDAERDLVEKVFDERISMDLRREFLRILIHTRSEQLAGKTRPLIEVPHLVADAVRAEAVFPSTDSAAWLLTLLSRDALPLRNHHRAILETLASREDFADALVQAILTGKVPKSSIPAYLRRQLAMVSSHKKEFAKFVGMDPEAARQKAKRIDMWKNRLSEDYLALADPREGRKLFQQHCASCHTLFGEGKSIGPDLTGSNRSSLDYFLINVLYPSEDVAPNYRLVNVLLDDGRTVSGVVEEEEAQVLTIRQVGKSERIDKSRIERRQASDVSMMPTGLLDLLKREDIRDLIGYFRRKTPLP